MMSDRLKLINEYVNNNVFVSFSELCSHFGVSSATMRRDLIELDKRGLLQRVHGGAKSIVHLQTEEPSLDIRREMNIEAKRRIAEYCLPMIKDGDSVVLDSSSTVYELARFLSESNLHITVITNDLYIGCILAPHPIIDLFMVGGVIRKGYYTSLGMFAENVWKQLHADKLFLGVDAINPSLGLMNYRIEEITSKRLMLDCCNEKYVLCDCSKFQTTAVLQICGFDSIDAIITDKNLSDSILAQFNSIGTPVIRA